MFVIERLIGVSVYCFALIMVCVFLAYSTIRCRRILACYTVILCIMAFFYVPYSTADLYRIYETVLEFAELDFRDFFHTFVISSTTPFARMFYWLAGKTGEPRLLPAVTTLICFRCIFYIISNAAERTGANRTNLAAAVFFFMSTGSYMVLISNIRTMLSLSLIAYCFYRETVERKYSFRHIFLYLIAVGTHNLGAAVFVLRLLCPLADRRISAKRRAAYLIFLFGGGVCTVAFFRPVLVELFEKACTYLLEKQYSYFWEYVIAGVVLLIEIIILFRFKQSRRGTLELFGGLSRLSKLCLLTAALFCFEFSVFHRLVTYIAPMLTAPLMLPVLKEGGNDHGNGVRRVLVALSLFALFLVCTRGSLCSLKFFEFG